MVRRGPGSGRLPGQSMRKMVEHGTLKNCRNSFHRSFLPSPPIWSPLFLFLGLLLWPWHLGSAIVCFWGCHGVLGGGRVLGPSLFLVGFSRALPGPVAAAADKPIVLWKLDTAKKVPSCCGAPLTSGPQPPLPARPVQLAGSATVSHWRCRQGCGGCSAPSRPCVHRVTKSRCSGHP